LTEQDFAQSAYTIKVGSYEYKVEYINDQWYYISWDKDESCFYSTPIDFINDPNRLGLGTEEQPYQFPEERPHTPEAESSGSIYRSPEKTESEGPASSPSKEGSDEDTPVVT
jgi:hypothetical protein